MLSSPIETWLFSWSTTFGLVFMRLSGLFISLPIINENFPTRIKIAFNVLISLFLLSTFQQPLVYPSTSGAIIIAIGEFLLGATMGLSVRLLYSIFSASGQIIGMQIGLGFAGFIDPSMQEETMITTRLIQAVVGVIFVISGGIHHTLAALAKSFVKIPVGTFLLSAVRIKFFTEQVSSAFKTAVVISLPMLAVMLLMQALLAIISRAVSEFNILFVSFSVLLAVGLVVLSWMLPNIILHAYELGSRIDEFMIDRLSAL